MLLSPLIIRRDGSPSSSFKQMRKDYSIGKLEDIKEVEGEDKDKRKKTFQISVKKSAGFLDPLDEEEKS